MNLSLCTVTPISDLSLFYQHLPIVGLYVVSPVGKHFQQGVQDIPCLWSENLKIFV